MTQPTTATGLPLLAVSVRDAAQMTGLGKDTLYQAAYAGKIRYKREGRRIVLLVESLLAWLEGNE